MLSRSTITWRVLTGRQPCHVHGKPGGAASRSVHSKSKLERIYRPRVVSGQKGRKTNHPFMAPRQVTIETKRPDLTTKSDILDSLKTFRMTAGQWARFSERGRQAVVILATPSFASWLEDDEVFIPRVLEAVTRPSKNPWVPNVVEVVCACVDGLSPHFDWIHYQRGEPAPEGFSLLHGTRNDILPRLWNPNHVTKTESSALQSTITFSRLKRTTTVTLPLANTLFKTGKQSTLVIAKWKAKDGLFVKMESKERSDISINVFGRLGSGIPSNIIPAVPLTPARRIISGLGNIVRQLDFGDDGIGPASYELENNVYEYLELKGRSNSTISVWALIVPADTQAGATPRPIERLLIRASSVKELWRQKHPRMDYVGQLIDKGAAFYRVLSGGGGWGSKQGLLSLDPQTSCIDDTDEAPFDFSSGSLEEQHASALGNMAQPGAYIQFFVADSSQIECGDHLHGPAKRHLKAAEMFQNSLVIGTVPSTIDDLPQPQKNNGQEASGIRGSHIKIRLGHFGCVSESGMFLSHTEVEPSHSDDQIELTNRQTSTKVDLPYSYFYRNTWKRTDKTKRPASMTPDDQPVHGPPAIEQEP